MEGLRSAVLPKTSTVLPCEAASEVALEQPHRAQPCAARTLFDRPCPHALTSCRSRVWRPSLLAGRCRAPLALGRGSGAAPQALLHGRCSAGAARALLGRCSSALLLGRCSGASLWALLRRRFSCGLWRRCSGVLGRRSLGAPRAPLTSAPRGSLLAVLGRCSRVAMRMLRSSAALGHCSAAAPRVLLEHRCPGHCRHAAIVCVRTVVDRAALLVRARSAISIQPPTKPSLVPVLLARPRGRAMRPPK